MSQRKEMEGIQLLPWDSQFFNARIARIEPQRLSERELQNFLKWSQEEKVDCLYSLADLTDATTLVALESNGFHLVDLRTTLNHPLKDLPPAKPVSLATPEDRSSLEEIAASAITHSRFYQDMSFPQEKVREMYRVWVQKDLSENQIVVLRQKTAVGFVSCVKKKKLGEISLVAMHPDYQGKGLGRELVGQALHWFKDQGCTSVNVVTQGINIPAIRLYETSGFKTQSVQAWYHRWFKNRDSQAA